MNKALISVLLVLVILSPGIDGQIRSPLYLLDSESMLVRTTEGIIAIFKVVTVSTSSDRAQGLMHIRHLPIDQGMVFSYTRDEVLSMWMKDTYIPLDMWFVDAEGRVVKVVTHTVPHSLKSIKSDTPVRAVVEVNAGLSTLLGVNVGSIVEHRTFERNQ